MKDSIDEKDMKVVLMESTHNRFDTDMEINKLIYWLIYIFKKLNYKTDISNLKKYWSIN